MKDPVVSVVMSVYNGLPYLQEAVESILRQTFTDLEFVIIDDDSIDETWNVLSAYGYEDKRVVLLRNDMNLGYTRSLNRGIRHSRGRYIARQDADDISRPRRLALQVDFMETHPDVGLVGTLPRFINEQGAFIEVENYPLVVDNDRIKKQLLDSNCFRHGSVMIRRKWIEMVGTYDPDLEPSEDYDLWLRLSEVTELANIPEPLYLYREHSDSESSRRQAVQVHNKAVALERALYRRFGSESPHHLKRVVARDYLMAVIFGFSEGNRSQAENSLEHAKELAPKMYYSGTLVEEVVKRFLSFLTCPSPISFVESIFNDQFPSTPHLVRAKSRIMSQLHMKQVFEAVEDGQYDQVGEHWWEGVRSDPRWLLNRGVLSIGMKNLFTRRLKHRSNRGKKGQDG